MRSAFILILTILIIILFYVIGAYVDSKNSIAQIKIENQEYEQYLGKTVYGTDVATVINKAVDQNEKNKIPKDEKGYYIENTTNSIKIDINMLTIEKTFYMEQFYNNDITQFVENFNLVNFKCSEIQYHKETGKIKKIVFEQLEY